MFSNCESRLCPSVSAVIPVPSEMTKAVRFMLEALNKRSFFGLGYQTRVIRKRQSGIVAYISHADQTVKPALPTYSPNDGEITLLEYVVSFEQRGVGDVERVGGRNASLGEMISNLAGAGASVPSGFATTADAYREFLEQSGLNDRINAALDAVDVDDVNALARTGAQIRQWIMEADFPEALDQAIRKAFAELAAGNDNLSVAVRSSATAEDL